MCAVSTYPRVHFCNSSLVNFIALNLSPCKAHPAVGCDGLKECSASWPTSQKFSKIHRDCVLKHFLYCEEKGHFLENIINFASPD